MKRSKSSADLARRRLVMGMSGLLASSGLALPWPVRLAMAQTPKDYKAVICIFLSGGNDGNDMLIPRDGAYGDYANAHGSLALPLEELVGLGLSNTDRRLGLNPAMAPMRHLVDRGHVAWIANAGPLVEPISADDVKNGRARMPSLLGSHPDQRRHVSGGVPGTFAANSGWGGRSLESMPGELVDGLLSNLSLSRDNWLMRGRYWSPTMAEDREYFTNLDLRHILDGGNPREFRAYQQAVGDAKAGDDLSFAYRSAVGNVLDEVLELRRVLDQVPAHVAPTLNDRGDHELDQRIRTTVRTLWAGREAGVRRQMAYIQWGGFDTHSDQRGNTLEHQDGQLGELAKSLADLNEQLTIGGLHDDVVTVVLSEFGRPLQPNSSGGTDHGWGNHFMVMGGPVRGNRLIGRMPEMILGGPDDMDADGQGRWVPTIHTDQISATVMEWFGLPKASLNQVFVNLENFPEPTLDLF